MSYTNPDYKVIYDGPKVEMGMISAFDYLHDPKHMLFGISRYKFVSKMLSGKKSVLEIGCGDGFFSPIVSSTVKNMDAFDIDANFINDANLRNPYKNSINFFQRDVLTANVQKKYSAVFSIDVFEHIAPKDVDVYMRYITDSIDAEGTCIIGIPSLESQVYASELSKLGHINCMNGDDFKDFLEKYFHNVFMFSMNDEVVHTGFLPMAHYLIAVCTSKIKGN